ncbi:MAG: hypothetical protein GY801_44115 [bacterium]|nr:hypothetical protein [bacterium]
MNRKLRIAITYILFGFLGAFSQESLATSYETAPIVAAHTDGEISRDSTIQVHLTEDIVDLSELNRPTEKSPLVFDPEIAGVAVWTARNIIEFRPDHRLPAGRKYVATLNLAEMLDTPEAIEPFSFRFLTRKQAFEIEIDGLQVMKQSDLKHLRLTGKMLTADPEDKAKIIKVLTAQHSGKGLNIQWTHHVNGREHVFKIDNILRQAESTELLLEWDGMHLGAEKSGEQRITVPLAGPFQLLQARAIIGAEQCIEIRFSDPLKKDQNLKGLIQLQNIKDRYIRTEVDGSILRIYHQRRWQNQISVTVEAEIKNIIGFQLGKKNTLTVDFTESLPKARFIKGGVILPSTAGLTIPFESYNLQEIEVEAIQIYEKNLPQFLQVNSLEGERELKRVGRTVWKKLVQLDYKPEQKNQWVRYGLDVTPLVQNNPGGLYRLQLSFKRPSIVYECPEPVSERETLLTEMPEEDDDWETGENQNSYWDYYEYDYYDYYDNRMNPCHPAYYRKYYDHNIVSARNVLVSDLGLIAKRGGKDVFVAVTDIKSAQPLAGVELSVMDFQQQVHSMAKTKKDGTAMLHVERKPFLVMAKLGGQTGFLKLDDGSALPLSHFDVGGQTVKKGLKGFLYGERGVWRPGDKIYLSFLLWDQQRTLPKDHPVIFELRNPKGQVVKVIKKKESLNGFYSFHTQSEPDAPTGDWTARVRVGGVSFEKILKIETVMPNRLKIGLDFGDKKSGLSSGNIEGELSSTWLHGAIAGNLNADVKLSFSARPTRFSTYSDYIFDDPVRRYSPEEQQIFEGTLNEEGKALVSAHVQTRNVSPGMLTAHFMTRVFEQSGAFSVDRFSLPYHPYERYLGIRLPKGDATRGMLLTDTEHSARIAMLDQEGNPVTVALVEVALYKLSWRWWWDQGANYVESLSHDPISRGSVEIKDGYGEWNFQVEYPSWGRYLVRACDTEGEHCTAKVIYIDWPGWAGRAAKDTPGGGANVLTFSSEKSKYQVGEKVELNIPTGKQGRGLVSIESGNKVLQADWIEGGEEATRYEFFATQEMTPNVYVHVTFLQPHLQAGNDLPIRMYGVIPIEVEDPATRLRPQIDSADLFVPEEIAQIAVTEAQGKPMTYTLAIVDEGLLGLTRFQTPDAWNHFYQRVALGVKTWDLFDMVAGAYSGALEKLLAIGGGDDGSKGKKKADRFPPMVRFLGPFELGAEAQNNHDVDIPQYVGAVRVMVVAGQHTAFGSAEKEVFVRKPLMILGTLPRVLGPDEEAEMPVAVFAMDESVKEVSLEVETDGPLSIVGASEKSIVFSEPGDDLVTFRVKTSSQIGIASALIQAVSGEEQTGQRIELDVRMPVGEVVDVLQSHLPKKEVWEQEISFPGISGTNQASLEVSRIPPLNLGKRLGFLIRYPHGCIEQTTSSVFPQVYLNSLLELSPGDRDEIQKNVKAGINRLQSFQVPGGGFAYWPGNNKANEWGSNYAGHFLLETQKVGYVIPPTLLERWKEYQQDRARLWESGTERAELIQAYRLYTLALAGAPELGAMNRLREAKNLPLTARWRLAAAYTLAGQKDAAEHLVKDAGIEVPEYTELSNTYGSDLRDRAMILESLVLMGRMSDAMLLVKDISEALSGGKWHSTQTTAYALIAVARYAGLTGDSVQGGAFNFSYSWGNEVQKHVSSDAPIVQVPLPLNAETSGKILLENSGEVGIYPRVIVTGTPKPGTETAAENGMSISVGYRDSHGNSIDPAELEQGTDFVVEVKIRNTSPHLKYEEVALSQIFPSGWEIHNPRLDPFGRKSDAGYEFQDIRDDRVYSYFDIQPGQTKSFRTQLNASYLGKFYLPMLMVEAMYDATINARVPGHWIRVTQPGKIE